MNIWRLLKKRWSDENPIMATPRRIIILSAFGWHFWFVCSFPGVLQCFHCIFWNVATCLLQPKPVPFSERPENERGADKRVAPGWRRGGFSRQEGSDAQPPLWNICVRPPRVHEKYGFCVGSCIFGHGGPLVCSPWVLGKARFGRILPRVWPQRPSCLLPAAQTLDGTHRFRIHKVQRYNSD